ncbi:MAG: CopG family transcriptional regulator [Xenococcus sp. (in: cyanobacteria)]
MKKKEDYNRVQIYLPDAIKDRFSELCRQRGESKSVVGKYIFSEYFRLVDEYKETTKSVPSQFKSVKQELNNLKLRVSELEACIKGILLTELNRVSTDPVGVDQVSTDLVVTQLVEEKIPNSLSDSSPEKVNPTEEPFFDTEEEKPVEEINPVGKSLTLESSKSEGVDFKENIEPEPQKIIEVKVPKSNSSKLKKNIVIPKDIQALNELGGIQIKEGSRLDHDVLDRYFKLILEGKFILQCGDGKLIYTWMSGGRHTKPVENYLFAKLYNSESRIKVAIPKLEKKYSLIIKSQPALDFLRDLSRTEREEVIKNWGIKFTFVNK